MSRPVVRPLVFLVTLVYSEFKAGSWIRSAPNPLLTRLPMRARGRVAREGYSHARDHPRPRLVDGYCFARALLTIRAGAAGEVDRALLRRGTRRQSTLLSAATDRARSRLFGHLRRRSVAGGDRLPTLGLGGLCCHH